MHPHEEDLSFSVAKISNFIVMWPFSCLHKFLERAGPGRPFDEDNVSTEDIHIILVIMDESTHRGAST